MKYVVIGSIVPALPVTLALMKSIALITFDFPDALGPKIRANFKTLFTGSTMLWYT